MATDVQDQHPVVISDGLIQRTLAIQSERVGCQREIGGKAVINGNPCIGRFASFVVVCHMCSPSIVKRANAIRILPGLEHLELFQKLIDGFASRVRNGTRLLQGY